MRVHASVPNHAAIQIAMDEHQEQHLKAYSEPSNLPTRSLYVDLPLPWPMARPVQGFDESTFFRKEWNKSSTNATDDEFFVSQQTADLRTLEKALGAASPVTRWREAHPDAVSTKRDVVRLIVREIERLLHEAGVERGKEMVKGGLSGVLLMVKKRM